MSKECQSQSLPHVCCYIAHIVKVRLAIITTQVSGIYEQYLGWGSITQPDRINYIIAASTRFDV